MLVKEFFGVPTVLEKRNEALVGNLNASFFGKTIEMALAHSCRRESNRFSQNCQLTLSGWSVKSCLNSLSDFLGEDQFWDIHPSHRLRTILLGLHAFDEILEIFSKILSVLFNRHSINATCPVFLQVHVTCRKTFLINEVGQRCELQLSVLLCPFSYRS